MGALGGGQDRKPGRRELATLPRLPVPPLRQTLQLFLKNARPVSSPQELQEAESLVQDLQAGTGNQLQAFLEQRAKNTENWLNEWWLNKAYLELRCPLPINLSPALSFPLRNFTSTADTIAYASRLIRGLLLYKEAIDKDEVKPDMAGKQPMDMSQYKLLFGTNRRPAKLRDVMRFGNESKFPIRHIVVARGGHFYKVNVVNRCGQAMNESQISELLHVIIQDSEVSWAADHPLGIVSSDDRDKWATVYERVKTESRQNAANLEDIESSLFLLALDQAPQNYDNRLNELHRQLLHGGGSHSNAGNRWFDKTLQFCVGQDGMSGITYEHSPAEGPPVAALMDYVMDYVSSKETGTAAQGELEVPKRLDFILSQQDKVAIVEAAQRIDSVVENLEVEMLQFKEFGKNVPKAFRLSPDSFCQLAFQLTFHKLHDSHPPTYETGTQRMFHMGRTDTIRLPSGASVAFVEAMRDPAASPQTRVKALVAAVAEHKAYTAAAMSGNGMDRHMLGLRIAAEELGTPVPPLFTHPTYQRLVHFQLSTSQVPTKNEALMAFGPSAEDCYGVCYNPQEKQLNVSCTTFRSGPPTSAKRFIATLVETLGEMRGALEQGQQSKL